MNKKYTEILELATKLNDENIDEIEAYEILKRIRIISQEESQRISRDNSGSDNFTYVSNIMVIDAYNYIIRYIEENNIDLHADVCITDNDYNNISTLRLYKIFLDLHKDYRTYISNYKGLNEKFYANLRKKNIFKIIGDKEASFITKDQKDRFMKIRKNNPKYIEDICSGIIEAINEVVYK